MSAASDAYDRAEKAREAQRAAVVRELSAVVERHDCHAHYVPSHGVYVTCRRGSVVAEWCWSFPSRSTWLGNFGAPTPTEMRPVLDGLLAALGDPGFDAALAAALARTTKEQAEALRLAEERRKIHLNKYHGD